MPTSPRYYNLHGICLHTSSPDSPIRRRIDAVFGPFGRPPATPDIHLNFRLASSLPPWQPTGEIVSESRFLRCALDGDLLSAHFPYWGTASVQLTTGSIQGILLPEALSHYGAFDDMVIILLGPLLRRRGFFSLHAFAAALQDQAVLLVGDIGTGKTTSGLSLLDGGWNLVSNDSPLLSLEEDVVLTHAYPGLLAAYDDTLTRFPSLRRFMGSPSDPKAKRAFAAQKAFDDVWQLDAPARLLLFPQITPGLTTHRTEPMSSSEALLALLPNSIERWDRAFVPQHLAILNALVAQASTYRLYLAQNVHELPALIAGLL